MEAFRVSRALCVKVRGQPSRYTIATGSVLKYAVIETDPWIAIEFGTLADVVHYIARRERAAPEDVSVEECQ
jgi:hypothetical protein